MLKIFAIFLVSFLVLSSCEVHKDHISFLVHNKNESFVSTFNESLVDRGCDVAGNFSFVVHGWVGSRASWILDLIDNLKTFRGGCIIFMNYSYYSDRPNYFESISHFRPVSNVLLKKLKQLRNEGISGDSIFMFGFSFGGRIAIEAAVKFGKQEIFQIDSEKPKEFFFCQS